MKPTRFLFPFTHGMQTRAVEQAILLAKSRNATLVPASFIHIEKTPQARGPRLEAVQQSKDFLEAVSCRAKKKAVPVEPLEVLTSDVVTSIETLAKERDCEGVLLFLHGQEGLLLDAKDVRQVIEHCPHKLFVFQLASKDAVSLHVC